MPPSRCCTALRFDCTFMTPVATTALRSGTVVAHTPKPQNCRTSNTQPNPMIHCILDRGCSVASTDRPPLPADGEIATARALPGVIDWFRQLLACEALPRAGVRAAFGSL